MQSVHHSYLPDETNNDRPSGEYPSSPHTADDDDVIREEDILVLHEQTQFGLGPTLQDANWDEQTVVTFVEPTMDDIQRMPPSIVFHRHTTDIDASWKHLATSVKWFTSVTKTKPIVCDDDILVARMFLGMGDHPYDIIPMLQQGGLTVIQATLTILFAQGEPS